LKPPDTSQPRLNLASSMAPPVYQPAVIAGTAQAVYSPKVSPTLQRKPVIGAPPVYRPAAIAGTAPAVYSPKVSPTLQRKPVIGAPPVYRPAAIAGTAPAVYSPKVSPTLQRKPVIGAPPVYRPAAIAGTAPAVYSPKVSPTLQRKPVIGAPPVYRPAAVAGTAPAIYNPKVSPTLQRKPVIGAPPVFQPQTAVQRHSSNRSTADLNRHLTSFGHQNGVVATPNSPACAEAGYLRGPVSSQHANPRPGTQTTIQREVGSTTVGKKKRQQFFSTLDPSIFTPRLFDTREEAERYDAELVLAQPVVAREVVGEVIVDVDREGEVEVPYELLYHATDSTGAVNLARGIDVTKGRHKLDFNPKNTGGFYVTNDKSQAEKWAKITQQRNGVVGSGVVVEYQVPTPDLEAHPYSAFSEVTEDWKDTVVKGRRNRLLHDYSWVEGPMLLNPRQSIRRGIPAALGGGHQIAIFDQSVVADWDGDQSHV
jgi:hypothetical protein